MRIIISLIVLCILLPGFVACTTMDSTKFVIYEQGSINLHPLAVKEIKEGENEGGDNQVILPDGSFVSVAGTPSLGNLYLITNLNDGTTQTARGQVEAEVSPTVTGQGNATGGADSSSTELGGDSGGGGE